MSKLKHFNKNISTIALVLFMIFSFSLAWSVPLVSSAQTIGIPCSGVSMQDVEQEDGTIVNKLASDCDFPALVTLAQNIINFLIIIAAPISGLAFAYAGFLILTAGGNSSQVEKAKGIFTKVAIGFVFVLSGWLIVHAIISVLLADSYNIKEFINFK